MRSVGTTYSKENFCIDWRFYIIKLRKPCYPVNIGVRAIKNKWFNTQNPHEKQQKVALCVIGTDLVLTTDITELPSQQASRGYNFRALHRRQSNRQCHFGVIYFSYYFEPFCVLFIWANPKRHAVYATFTNAHFDADLRTSKSSSILQSYSILCKPKWTSCKLRYLWIF